MSLSCMPSKSQSGVGTAALQKRFAVVVNPRSAHGRTGRRWPSLAEPLERKIGPFRLLQTERPGHAAELVRQVLREGFDRIVSVGGDGTHHEVINGFFENGAPINPAASMAILPMGSGSDLARTLHIPRGAEAIPHAASEWVTRLDVGRATFLLPDGECLSRLFITTCHIGMGGAVVERVNRGGKVYGGLISYFVGVVSTLATYRNPKLELDIDGEPLVQVCRDIVVANGEYDGGGMHVAPDARLDDGVFDVYVIGDTGRFECVANLPRLYRGRLMERPDRVRHCRARRIAVGAAAPVPVNLDGEVPGYAPVVIDILPEALRIVTASPEHVPAPREAFAHFPAMREDRVEPEQEHAAFSMFLDSPSTSAVNPDSLEIFRRLLRE